MSDKTRRKFLLQSVSSLGALYLYGCKGKGAGGETDASPLGPTGVTGVVTNTITVSPANITLRLNKKQNFTASGGTGSYTWSVDDTTLGSINSSTGAFRAHTSNTGTLTVTATDTAGQMGTATVEVVIANLDPITITPSDANIPMNTSQVFTASGGTGSYTWSLLPAGTSVGSINKNTGLFTATATALNVGTATVLATDSSGNQGTTLVTVSQATITVSPATVSVEANGTQTFKATGGSGAYEWSTSNNLGSVVKNAAGNGDFTAFSNQGTVSVIATDANTSTGTAVVTIIAKVT